MGPFIGSAEIFSFPILTSATLLCSQNVFQGYVFQGGLVDVVTLLARTNGHDWLMQWFRTIFYVVGIIQGEDGIYFTTWTIALSKDQFWQCWSRGLHLPSDVRDLDVERIFWVRWFMTTLCEHYFFCKYQRKITFWVFQRFLSWLWVQKWWGWPCSWRELSGYDARLSNHVHQVYCTCFDLSELFNWLHL